PVVYVTKQKEGTPIFRGGSVVYPEDVVKLWAHNQSFSNHDVFSVAFSVHGEGNITVYPQPSNFEIDIEAESDEDYEKMAQEIIEGARDIHIESSTPERVAEFIDEVEFVYE